MEQGKNLFEQLNVGALACVGALVGVDNPGPIFRNYLREVPPLPDGFTVGEAARAYLAHRTAALEALAEKATA